MMNFYQNHIKQQLPFAMIIGLWCLYAISYIILKQNAANYVGYLAFMGQVGLEIVAIVITFFLWKKSSQQNKKIFGLFFVSLIFAAITDASYNITANILKVTHFPALIDSIFDIPFLIFLILQLIAWMFIFSRAKPEEKKRNIIVSYLPIAIITIMLFVIFIFGVTWKVHPYSSIGLYIICDTILQVLCYVFALLCLIAALNKHIRFVSIGLLVIIASDFIVHSYILADVLMPASLLEVTWTLGLLLMVFGLYGMLKDISRLEDNKWLNNINSVQAQCAFWSFVLCMLSITAFWIINYAFIGDILFKTHSMQNFPSILIIFSILAVLISMFFSKSLSAPFIRVEHIINLYMQGKNINSMYGKYDGSIYEFEHLEKFLKKSFSILREKNKMTKLVTDCVTQVSHDIRTPLFALESLADDFSQLDPDKSHILKKISSRISHIADSFLNLMKIPDTKSLQKHGEQRIELVFPLVEEVVSEKKIRCKNKKIDIKLQIDMNARFACAKINASEFMRAISNLLDNAIQALGEKNSEILIRVKIVYDFIRIEIKDNGCGIPQDKIKNIFKEGVSFGEHQGHGYGLSYVQSVIDSIMGGELDIRSEVGQGTTIGINLPISEKPDWLADTCVVNNMIYIIDDDPGIFDLFKKIFAEQIKQEDDQFLKFYNTPEDFLKFYKTDKNCTIFMDYHFSDLKYTGLDFIKHNEYKVCGNIYIITNDYDSEDLKNKLNRAKIKMVPKPCLQSFKIYRNKEVR